MKKHKEITMKLYNTLRQIKMKTQRTKLVGCSKNRLRGKFVAIKVNIKLEGLKSTT